jgi:hypothetical protein
MPVGRGIEGCGGLGLGACHWRAKGPNDILKDVKPPGFAKEDVIAEVLDLVVRLAASYCKLLLCLRLWSLKVDNQSHSKQALISILKRRQRSIFGLKNLDEARERKAQLERARCGLSVFHGLNGKV